MLDHVQRLVATGGLALCAATAPAFAADLYVTDPPPGVVEEVIFHLGAGGQLQPKFEGSPNYEFVPYPIAYLEYLRLPVVGEMITGEPNRYTIYPSINYMSRRDARSADFLRGLDPVGSAFELGPGFAFQYGHIRAFGEVRFGLTGHGGVVAETGLDLITNPTRRLEVRLGPRFGFASGDYMDTYFGVTPAEAARPQTRLEAFDPGGGIKDVGFSALGIFDATDRVRIYGRAEWSRYVGDALESPIVAAGQKDQFTAGIGLSYRFGVDLMK